MDLKKFKKFTSSDKEDKITYYGVDNYFEYLKVIKIIDYYTVEVIIYNRDKLNKWIFALKGVKSFNEKLTDSNKEFIKKKLESMVLDKYIKFNIDSYKLNNIVGTLYFESTLYGTINTSLINIIINITVLKDKMDKIDKKQKQSEKSVLLYNQFKSNNFNSVNTLPTIYENNPKIV